MIPIRNVYYLLCYAWGHLEEANAISVDAFKGMHRVEDLLGKVLAEGTFRLVRRGLDRGYRETTEEIAGLRGKLEVSRTASSAVRVRGRTICTFEEFSPDVLHNRILRTALQVLLRSLQLSPHIRMEVALAYEKLAGVSEVTLHPGVFRRVQLGSNQRLYRFLISVCELVLDSALATESQGDVRFTDFRRDEARMWKLFEDFVARFYAVEQSEYRVVAQRKLTWHDTVSLQGESLATLPEMTPDLVMESRERRIILDTKFYANPMSERWGSRKLHAHNLYQLLEYLENRQRSLPAGPQHEGVLLYASTGNRMRVDLSIRGFRVQARTVDLSAHWQEIHNELLEILAEQAPRAQ